MVPTLSGALQAAIGRRGLERIEDHHEVRLGRCRLVRIGGEADVEAGDACRHGLGHQRVAARLVHAERIAAHDRAHGAGLTMLGQHAARLLGGSAGAGRPLGAARQQHACGQDGGHGPPGSARQRRCGAAREGRARSGLIGTVALTVLGFGRRFRRVEGIALAG